MTALASRLVTAKFRAAPAGGTLGAGNRLEFRLSQEAWNLTTGEPVEMFLDGPIDPANGAMGFWDPAVATPQAGVRLVCNDDPNLSPQGTVWTVTPFVDDVPGTPYPVSVSVGDSDPVFLATLARPVNSSVSYGVQFDDGTTTLPNVTRVTVTNGSLSGTGNHATVATGGGGGSAHIIEDEGTPLTARANLNFIGAGVTATDNAGAGSTDVTIPGGGVTNVTGTAPIASSGGATPAISIAAATTGAVGAVQLATPSSDVTAGHVVQANDTRLSDSRAPTGAAGGDLAGTYPNPTLTAAGTAGTYAYPASLTTDSKGRVTGVTAGAAPIYSDEAFNFTAAGDAIRPFATAATLNIAGVQTRGTGTLTYFKSLAASPNTYNSISGSVSFAVGDALKVTCATPGALTAVAIPRTA